MSAAQAIAAAHYAPLIDWIEAGMRAHQIGNINALTIALWPGKSGRNGTTEQHKHGYRIRTLLKGRSNGLPTDTIKTLEKFFGMPAPTPGNPVALFPATTHHVPELVAPSRKPKGTDDFSLVINDGVATLTLNLTGLPISQAMRTVQLLQDIGLIPRSEPPRQQPHEAAD